MKPILALAAAAATLQIATAVPGGAQEPLPDPGFAGVRLELAALNETLEQIEALLLRHLEGQQLDLVLKRMEVTASRITHLERELDGLMGQRESISVERLGMRRSVDEARAELATGPDAEGAQPLRRFIEDNEAYLGQLDDRERNLDARIATVENRLAALRTDMEDWQSYFDRELAGE